MERVQAQNPSAAKPTILKHQTNPESRTILGRTFTTLSTPGAKALMWLALPSLFAVAKATDGDDACKWARKNANYNSCHERPDCLHSVQPKVAQYLGDREVKGYNFQTLTEKLCGDFNTQDDVEAAKRYNIFLADPDDISVDGKEPDGAEECKPLFVEKHLNQKCETRELPLDAGLSLTPSTVTTAAAALFAVFVAYLGARR